MIFFIFNIFYWLCSHSCPIFPPLFHSALLAPSHPQPPTLSSCPWVIYISSLASTFPILFLTTPWLLSLFFLLRFYLFYFLERGDGREKERQRNINVWLPLTWPPTGDLACNPGMCPDWESNWWPFGSQLELNPLSYTSQGPLTTFYHLCYLFPVPFSPFSPSPSPTDNPPCYFHFCDSVPVLVVS